MSNPWESKDQSWLKNSKEKFSKFRNKFKKSSSINYVRDLDDRYDKFLFTSLVFGGIFLIILIRVLGDSFFQNQGIGLFDWVAIILAILMISLYSLFIYFSSSRSSLSIDRASDNVYYLGLLYTLASLSYSLIKLGGIVSTSTVSLGGIESTSTESQGLSIISLLPDFGLALASTIAGIFCRVLLQQMRGDVVDVESEARIELGEASRALRSNIQNIVADLKILSATVSDSLNEVNKEMVNSIRLTAEENSKVIREVAGEFKLLSKQTDQQIKKMGEFTTKTSESVDKVLNNIFDQLENSSNLPEGLNKQLETTIIKIEEMSEKIILNSNKNEEATRIALESTQGALENLSNIDIGQISEKIYDAQNSLVNFNKQIDSIGNEIAETSIVSNKISAQSKEASEVTAKYLDTLEKASIKISNILKGGN